MVLCFFRLEALRSEAGEDVACSTLVQASGVIDWVQAERCGWGIARK